MPYHTILEIGKGIEVLAASWRHDGTQAIEILISATKPCSFGNGKHVRIEMIVPDHVTLGW